MALKAETNVEAALSDLPPILSWAPWITHRRPGRTVRPVRVTMKEPAAISAKKLAEHVAHVKAGEVERAIVSPRVAVAMLEATGAFGGWRNHLDARAWAYFERHVEATLFGVIPVAVGASGSRRTLAERLLRELALDHEAEVRVVAKAYGKQALESVEEILARDRRFDCPNVTPPMPATWRPETFARPHLHDGRVLPLVAVDRIGHMLAFSTLDRRYEGLDDLKAVCDPRSLAELAWAMARAWDGEKSSQWMLESIAHLGDDVIVRRTTPAIAHPYVVHVLGHVATSAAATELCTIAWRINHAEAKPAFRAADVAAAFATIARKRGVTVEQVEDSLMPTLAIAASSDADVPVSSRLATLRCKSIDARVRLDYGSRTFDVGFDERLDPFVESARVKLRDLPRAGRNDDPEKVERAAEIWRELQEDVAAIADVRLRSLERAMVSGRSWTLEAFRHAWMDHPLMHHLSRSVVWRCGTSAFRIAQDGTFADVNDAPLTPMTAADVTVAHPAEMSEDERIRWSRVLADYLIIQPIEQLSRRVISPAAASTVLVPVVPIPLAEFYERLRTKRFEMGVSGREQTASRLCTRSAARLRLTLDIEHQRVVRLPLVAERGGTVVDLACVHAVDVSELAHDLEL